MNKRIQKKIKSMATHKHTQKIIVRDFTLQEAWDKIAEMLAYEGSLCYFVNYSYGDHSNTKRLNLHYTDQNSPILLASKTYEEIRKTKPIEPEEVTFYCKSCSMEEITAQQDIDQDGECDRCFEGKNEMWSKELKHQDSEYMDSKL